MKRLSRRVRKTSLRSCRPANDSAVDSKTQSRTRNLSITLDLPEKFGIISGEAKFFRIHLGELLYSVANDNVENDEGQGR